MGTSGAQNLTTEMGNEKKHIDQLLDSYQPPAKRNKQEAWELLQTRIEGTPASKGRSVVMYWISGAAAAVIIVLLGLFQSGIFAPVEQNMMATNQTVWLPDSSMVLLNSRSKVEYNYQLIGGKRQIKLDGEAYFKVEKGKPFQIDFPGGKLQVLGTEFNLSAYSEDFVQVDCVSGKVEIEMAGGKVTLVKNQGMSFVGGKLEGPFPVSEKDVQNHLDGYYNWENKSLEQLFRYIGYRFGYSVEVSASVKNRNFGGTIPLKNMQQSIDVLSAAMQLKVEINEAKKQIKVEAY